MNGHKMTGDASVLTVLLHHRGHMTVFSAAVPFRAEASANYNSSEF